MNASVLNSSVLVLNRYYQPVHVTSVKRAFSLLYQGIAKAIDQQYRLYEFEDWAALSAALERHMPSGVAWTEPTGGFVCWLTLPEEVDTLALRPAAIAAGVAYVPGPPFHVGDGGRNSLRLSFSQLTEAELDTAVGRLAGALRAGVLI